MALSEKLHTKPLLSLSLLAIATALALVSVTPLQYDFSFTTLFVGEGEDYDRLSDYLRRFGNDVNFVMVAVESEGLFSDGVVAELEELTTQLEALEGVHEVISPTNVTDLVGDGGSLQTRQLVPSSSDDWASVRESATGHPLLGGTVFGDDGEHALILVRFGVESSVSECADGLDNDASGGADCRDRSCRTRDDELCGLAVSEDNAAACTNGLDDDGDGALDCADPGCVELRACEWTASAEGSRKTCGNGLDDDGDGSIDCADSDCMLSEDVPFCNTARAVSAIVEARNTLQDVTGIRYHLGGIPVVSEEYTRVIQHDLTTFLPLTGTLVALVLFVVFRSWRGVILPMFVVVVGVLWAMGAMMGTGGKLNMINSSMPTLLLVIAVADTVHIIARYLEEAPSSSNSEEASKRTMRHMAGACLLTSVTSAVGFGSLMSAHLPIIRGFGGYTAIGIMLAFTVTMLFVPLVLSRLSLPQHAPETNPVERLGNHVTEFFVAAVTKYRRVSVVVVALTVAGALAGAARVVPDSHLMEELDEANPVAISNAVLEDHHGGVLSGALVFNGQRGAFSNPEALRALERVAATAEDWRTDDGRVLVSNAFSLTDLIKEAHAEYRGDERFRSTPETRAAVTSLLDQVAAEDRADLVSADYSVTHLTFRMYSVGSRAWSSLRAELEAAVETEPTLAETDWYFTGSSTLGQDAMGFMTRDLVTSLGLATVIIMVLMTILFRSVRLGLVSMIPNLFPLLITLGLVGYMGINLRVSTAVVFSISLGIAVDDTIHVLVRFREELGHKGRTYEEALLAAIRGAGRGVVFTTIILCAGFGTLTFSEFTAVHELGVLGGVTLFAALIGDLLVLPLVLLLLGPGKRLRSAK